MKGANQKFSDLKNSMNYSPAFIYLSYFMDANTPLYGGEMGVLVKPDRSIANGDTANTKQITLNNHSGTHIDYPNHFFIEGLTSEYYTAEQWIFHNPYLLLVNAIESDIILLTDEQLNSIPNNTDFLIIKTGFGQYRSQEKYWKYNPGLSSKMYSDLKRHVPELKIVGMDFISITAFQNRELGREAHREFLGGNSPILLVEDMNLSELFSSPKLLICSPMMIAGLDGSPVTIIAKVE